MRAKQEDPDSFQPIAGTSISPSGLSADTVTNDSMAHEPAISDMRLPPPTHVAVGPKFKPIHDEALTAVSAFKVDVLWAIDTVVNHYSVNASSGKPALFRSKFPNSEIAPKFPC